MSIVAIADTHTVIWYLHANPRLSAVAKATIEHAATSGDQIGLSSITLIEIVYLIEKGRIAAESLTRLAAVLEKPDSLFVEVVPDIHIARALSQVDFATVPDMPDRIIAATALYMRLPVISKDRRIHLSYISTLW